MTIKMNFVYADGRAQEVLAENGMTILQVAHENGIDMEGACEGNMACSTCHVVVCKDYFDRLPTASEDEEEMLDLASGLKATSRLGCQIVVEPSLDGITFFLPKERKNMMGL